MTPRRHLPQAPDGLWDRPDMVDALARRDMSDVLRIYQRWTGATQPQIANAAGIGQPSVSAILAGKRQVTTLEMFERFADGLDLPRRLLGLADRTPPEPAESAGPAETLPAFQSARPSTIEQGVRVLSELWHADLEQNDQLVSSAVEPGMWNETTLDWLLHSGDPATRATATGRRVGIHDVTALRATTATFADLDNRFGGGHARRAFVQFLATDVQEMMNGRYGTGIGRRLFSAVAEAMLLAAWMAYDSGRHGLAQRYFVQALHIAPNGEDELLAGSVLSAMSHQASYLGEYRHAANLARAAVTGTKNSATPTLTAQFHAMEARALARLGDGPGCDTAMSAAEKAFAKRNPDDDPEWIGYFDEAELSAEFGHCFRDLGRSDGAKSWAGRSVGASADGAFPRSDFFAAMVLADAHLDHGDPEPACRVASKALRIGDQLKSARCAEYVREFRQRLDRYQGAAVIREFNDRATSHRLWALTAA